jgi:hypothetical protein
MVDKSFRFVRHEAGRYGEAILDTGYWILDTRYWMVENDVVRWALDAGRVDKMPSTLCPL